MPFTKSLLAAGLLLISLSLQASGAPRSRLFRQYLGGQNIALGNCGANPAL